MIHSGLWLPLYEYFIKFQMLDSSPFSGWLTKRQTDTRITYITMKLKCWYIVYERIRIRKFSCGLWLIQTWKFNIGIRIRDYTLTDIRQAKTYLLNSFKCHNLSIYCIKGIKWQRFRQVLLLSFLKGTEFDGSRC